MSMAENIRNLRLKKGMTQEELGKFLGVQKSAIRKYESGLVENIPRTSIKKMAELFDVSPSYIMGFEEKPTLAGELSEAEQAILELFRKIPPEQQEMVLQMIRAALHARQ